MKNIGYLDSLRKTAKYHLLSNLSALKPLKLRLAVTNRCNARCIMCNVWKSDQEEVKKTELSVEEYEKLFKNSRDFLSKINHISITGGEPTLRSDLTDILKVINKYFPKASININTNAFNTERIMNFVKEAIALTSQLSVMVSLDGMGEAHGKIRGIDGVFEKTFKSVQELIKFRDENKGKLKIRINHILSQFNYKEFEKVSAFCKENKLEITPIVMQRGEFFNNDDLDISLNEEAKNYLIPIFEQLIALDKQNLLGNIEVLEQLMGMPRDYNCWAGKIMLLIEDNGVVYPNGGCPSSQNFGNIRECDYNLKKLLSSKKAKQVFDFVNKCRSCRLACETLTTLRQPEALSGYRKLKSYE